VTTYFLRRVFFMVPTLVGITLLTFLLIRLAPGNGATASAGAHGRALTVEEQEARKKLYGLDKPPIIAYGVWLSHLLQGDFGESYADHRPVLDKIKERLPLTLFLNGSSLALTFLIAVPLGIYSALRRDTVIDHSISLGLLALYCIPTFVAALVLIMLVAGGDYLNLLPMYGVTSFDAETLSPPGRVADYLLHMVLPITCLTYIGLASLTRYSRISLLEVLARDFVRTARAKGLPDRAVIFRHALRNALMPLITLLALEIPGLIGGSIIIEQLFTLPGTGHLVIQSINGRDTNVIMAITTLTAVLTLVSYLIADMVYALCDPRVRYQ
jgi:peptide/nickel transport system permease protein